MTLSRLKYLARKKGRIKDGLALCENCDTPASRSASIAISYLTCAPCAYGEADSFDSTDLIAVPPVEAKIA
jgi:hypothetical protein